MNGRVGRKNRCVQSGTVCCRLLPKGVRGTGGPPRGARRVKNVNLSFARKGGREIYVFDTLSWKRNTAYQLQASVQGSQSCRGVRGREVPAAENVAFKVGHRAVSSTAEGGARRTAARLTHHAFSSPSVNVGVQNPSERALFSIPTSHSNRAENVYENKNFIPMMTIAMPPASERRYCGTMERSLLPR